MREPRCGIEKECRKIAIGNALKASRGFLGTANSKGRMYPQNGASLRHIFRSTFRAARPVISDQSV
jgi:hypothetical protein